MIGGRVASPLVGREKELQLLWEQVRASADQGLRVAVVRGPAGIGKSRLLEALVEGAREFGATVMAGRSAAVGSFPYGALSDALAAYARSSVGAAIQLRRAGEPLVRLVPSMAALEHLEPADMDRLGTIQAAFNLLRAITERRPLVLIIDDAHAADAESCEVVAALARHAADRPWTLVLGWRDPAQDVGAVPRELLVRLHRDRSLAEVTLDPFDRATATTFLSGLLSEGLPAPSLVEMLQRRTQGNPYYLEEMLRWLRSTGRLQRVGIQWMAEDADETELPPSIEDALRARLYKLPEDARGLLHWLAVTGGRTDIRLLETVSGGDAGQIAKSLDCLIEAGLAVDAPGRPPECAVSHPLVAECAYRDLGVARRRLAHRAVASVLAHRGAPPAAIAKHLTRAADPGDAEALAAAVSAGEDAEARIQYSRAVGWYRQALEIVADTNPTLRNRILDRLSELAGFAGEFEIGRSAIAELLTSIPENDRIRRATLLRRLASIFSFSGEDTRARAIIEEGLALASEAGPEAAQLLSELAMGALTSLPAENAMAIIRRGEDIAAGAGEPAREASVFFRAFKAIATINGGYPTAGRELALEAGRAAMAEGYVLPFGFAVYAAAMANWCLGQCGDAARGVGALSEPFTEDMGMMWGAVWSWSAHAQALRELGRLEESMESCLVAEDIGRRCGALTALAHPIVEGALVLILRAEPGAASSHLREARELLDSHPNIITEGRYWYVASLLAEADDDVDAAMDALNRMWRVATDWGQRFLLGLRPQSVHLLVRGGRSEEALLLAREIAADVAGRNYPYADVTASAGLAAALAATGQLDSACVTTERTLDLADGLEVPLLQSLVRLQIGEAFAPTSLRGNARRFLHEAHQRFEEMGANWPRDRAAQALKQLGAVPAVVSMKPVRPSRPKHPLDALSEREREVARLAVQGMSSRRIALRLCISERTVENHLQKSYTKLEVHSRAELIALVAGTTVVVPERDAR